MCLIFIAYECLPSHRLLVAANRDEFHRRPTEQAAFWNDENILAGRDLEGGGTWMGVSRGGRFAALTNFRSASNPGLNPPSRGALVTDFLRSSASAVQYLQALGEDARRFNGFSLLVADETELLFFSNKDCAVRKVSAGVHGLSNHLLNEPWPKVTNGVDQLAAMVDKEHFDVEQLFLMLADKQPAADTRLPDTGVGIARERKLSSMFIFGGSYGTRSSTVIDIATDARIRFEERSFDEHANETTRVVHQVEE